MALALPAADEIEALVIERGEQARDLDGVILQFASMVMTIGPRALRNPASRAADLPKLRRKRTYPTDGSRAASASMTEKLPSRLPSSTKRSSYGSPSSPSTSVSFAWSSSKVPSSSKRGMTMLTRGSMSRHKSGDESSHPPGRCQRPQAHARRGPAPHRERRLVARCSRRPAEGRATRRNARALAPCQLPQRPTRGGAHEPGFTSPRQSGPLGGVVCGAIELSPERDSHDASTFDLITVDTHRRANANLVLGFRRGLDRRWLRSTFARIPIRAGSPGPLVHRQAPPGRRNALRIRVEHEAPRGLRDSRAESDPFRESPVVGPGRRHPLRPRHGRDDRDLPRAAETRNRSALHARPPPCRRDSEPLASGSRHFTTRASISPTLGHPELWQGFFRSAPAWVIARAPDGDVGPREAFLAGALACVAVMLKHPAVLSGVLAGMAVVVLGLARGEPRVAARAAGSYTGGVALVLGLTLLPFWLTGTFHAFWELMVDFILHHYAPGAAAGSGVPPWLTYDHALFAVVGAVCLLASGYAVATATNDRRQRLTGFWIASITLTAAATVIIQRRALVSFTFTYYWVVLSPFLALCCVWGIRRALPRNGKSQLAIALFAGAALFLYAPRGTSNPHWSYRTEWAGWLDILRGRQSREEHLAAYYNSPLDSYLRQRRVADAILAARAPGTRSAWTDSRPSCTTSPTCDARLASSWRMARTPAPPSGAPSTKRGCVSTRPRSTLRSPIGAARSESWSVTATRDTTSMMAASPTTWSWSMSPAVPPQPRYRSVPSKILFITRAFPPAIGGMQNYAYNLYEHFRQHNPVRLLALSRSPKHLAWFVPYALAKGAASLLTEPVSHIYVGDAVMALRFGLLLHWLHPKARTLITVHGLDLTYELPSIR